MTRQADASAREQALCAEDVIASAKSLSVQARALRERGRELAYLTKRNRSEAFELLAITRQTIKDAQNLAEKLAKQIS